jgi:TorA-specific chaperone
MSAVHAVAEPGPGDASAALLDWLAGLLSAPMSVGAVTACRSRDGTVLFEAIADELGCARGIETMRSVLDADETDDHVAARLSGCYTRLFDGPGGPATVSLYESTYSGPARRLHQQPAAAMASMLRRCDLSVRAGHGEPADHLSLELALLATLLRAGDRARAAQLRRQLMAWVPQVAAACAAADPSGFYRGVSIALLDTLMSLHALPSTRACHERSS